MAEQWASWLLRVGSGQEGWLPGQAPALAERAHPVVRLPEAVRCSSQTLDHLLNDVFGADPQHLLDPEFVVKRAVLPPKNDVVQPINDLMIARLPGCETVCLSIADE